MVFSEIQKRVKKKGLPPGTPTYTGDNKNTEPPLLTIITYNQEKVCETTGTDLSTCPEKINDGTTWINLERLHNVDLINTLAQRFNIHPLTVEDILNVDLINTLAQRFNIHPLTVEDILNVDQRPKVEEFDNYIFITLKVLLWNKNLTKYLVKQLSLVVGKNFILTFQEMNTPLLDTLRKRLLKDSNQRLRKQKSDYLAYRILDLVIDEYFVVLEGLGEQIETIEEAIIASPNPTNPKSIYRLKREMLLLRKSIWPMREAINHLMQNDNRLITKNTRVYLRDLYDHTIQAIETLEIFRDMLTSMLDTYLSSITNRMNEIMKTLTIMSTIFIPITAIASIFGMNFVNIPGIHAAKGFATIMAIMIGLTIIMLLYFKRKKWI